MTKDKDKAKPVEIPVEVEEAESITIIKIDTPVKRLFIEFRDGTKREITKRPSIADARKYDEEFRALDVKAPGDFFNFAIKSLAKYGGLDEKEICEKCTNDDMPLLTEVLSRVFNRSYGEALKKPSSSES